MTTTVEVLNYEKLLAKMRAITPATIRKVQGVMSDQADEIVDFARRLAPGPRSGALRRSITWHWGKKVAPGSVGLAQVRAPNFFGGELTITIVAGNDEAYYARWLEFGTVKMTKRPFFFPAYRANRRQMKNAVRAAVRAAAKEVAAS